MYSKSHFFINHRNRFTDKKFVITLFAVVDNIPIIEAEGSEIISNTYKFQSDDSYEKGDIIKLKVNKDIFMSFIEYQESENNKNLITVKILELFEDQPLFKFSDVFTIKPGDIENFKGVKPMLTSYGRFFVNYVLLVYPFGDKIEYINKNIKSGTIEKIAVEKALTGEITFEKEYKRYMLALYTYGHFPELCVSCVSLKSLTTSPEVKKRRAELIEKHKHELNDPLVAKKINDELMTLDKQWLEGDPAKRFYDARGNSAWNVQRAKMAVNIGGVPAFSDEVGKIEYIPGALNDGWNKNNFDTIVNEIYKGSYFRGVQTQLGGEQTNIVLRMFQGSKITDEDCGSKTGLSFFITEDNISEFIGMYEAVTDKIVTKENSKDFIGKTIYLRTPITCKSTGSHFCIKCFGELYRKRDAKSIELDAVYYTSKLMLLSMKNMHGTEIQTTNLKLDDYLVSNF